jgi:hypothetical protein
MKMNYWVFTNGTGKAYINMHSNVSIKAPADGTYIHFGTFLPQQAGEFTSYDAGVCKVQYKEDRKEQKPPTITDFWFKNMQWFGQKQRLAVNTGTGVITFGTPLGYEAQGK